VVLITASLGYSLYLQVKRNLKQNTEHRTCLPDRQAQNSDPRLQTINSFTAEHRDRIRAVFKKRRYRECKSLSNAQKMVFTKNSIGRWSGVIFHLGLLLVIMSAIAVLCFQQRGFVQLIEGDLFDGKENNFLVKNKGVFAGEFDAGFKTHLSKLTHGYWEKGEIKFLESAVTIIKGEETINKKLSINYPLLINGTNIYQSYDYGYTLSFVLKKPSGEEALSHFNIDRAPTVYKPAIGETDFPTTFYLFEMKFYPDVTNKSFYLTKPILYLTVFEENNRVFSGLIIPGNAVKIKEDILYFADTRYWSGLTFIKNPGMFIAYIGFTIGILGCALMFLFPCKEIHLTLNTETGLFNITGTTKRYHAIFKEEMDEIKTELRTIKND
jgi:cytochrome c biogenesis protein ResB